jgi:cell shape-determining protein MreC
MLAAMSAVLVLSAISKAQPPISAPNSPNSATRANETTSVVSACAAAAKDLAATRRLAEALERENAALKERLATAVRAEGLLNELNDTRRSENEALRSALASQSAVIAAKDIAIAKQDELIAQLKKRKTSPWKRVGDILIGAAAAAILR